MSVIQISLVLDNTPGKFLEVSEFLGTEGINIRAISVADTADISTVRFVTDNPKKTVNVLTSRGYTIKETEVLAVEVPDHPGGLQAILKPLKTAFRVVSVSPSLSEAAQSCPKLLESNFVTA